MMTKAAHRVAVRAGALGAGDVRALLAGSGFALDPEARAGVERAAAVVGAIAERDESVYGINTGFGKLAQTRVGRDQLGTLQRNLVVSHACGVGPPLERDVVRLVLALKANSLARGYSGVRWSLIETLLACLERDLLPVIPAQGSVGASGDLAPLAHLSAALIGIGEVTLDGRTLEAAEGLRQARIAVVELQPKEGLALLNGTQVSTALALRGLVDAENLLAASLVAGALTIEAALASVTPFDPRIHAVRGHRGQSDVAAALRCLVAGTEINESHRNCDRVQDPYSLRCIPQVLGACLHTIRDAAAVLVEEANAVSDNPLVFADSGDVISGGNFHGEPIAFAADALAVAIAEMGNLSERRTALLVDPTFSQLPAFVATDPGLESGYMIAQVTAAALASENKMLAHPASVDSIPTSAGQEDHVSMATHGARRLSAMTRNVANIIAVELLAAARGITFRRPLRTSDALEAVLVQIGPIPQGDHYLAPEIARVAELVRSGTLTEELASLFPTTQATGSAATSR